MTKKQCVNKLMSLYLAEEKWRSFFQKVVDDLVGEGKIVSEENYHNIVEYLSKFT